LLLHLIKDHPGPGYFQPLCAAVDFFRMDRGFEEVFDVVLKGSPAIGGGVNAGPVFKDVMSFALEALRIPPTGTKPGRLKLTWHGR